MVSDTKTSPPPHSHLYYTRTTTLKHISPALSLSLFRLNITRVELKGLRSSKLTEHNMYIWFNIISSIALLMVWCANNEVSLPHLAPLPRFLYTYIFEMMSVDRVRVRIDAENSVEHNTGEITFSYNIISFWEEKIFIFFSWFKFYQQQSCSTGTSKNEVIGGVWR